MSAREQKYPYYAVLIAFYELSRMPANQSYTDFLSAILPSVIFSPFMILKTRAIRGVRSPLSRLY